MSVLRNVIIPTLGLDMEEARIQTWLEREGEAVRKDEPLLVVETDKASVEINAPTTGILRQILRPEGATVPVTHTIAVIETSARVEASAEGVAVRAAPPSTPEMVTPQDGGIGLAPLPPEPQGLRASPAARRLARALGIQLHMLKGTGPQGRIQGEDITDGTFTITNLGMFGIDSFTPLVNPPETAILGVGRIAERPVGWEGQIALRPTMSLSLSLSVDHRVVDGAPAAKFLQRVRQLLEEPRLLP